LGGHFDEVLNGCYQDARQDVKTETQLPLSTFPESCPFSKLDSLDLDFYPKRDAT
jgi:hypothetical protein